MKTSFIVTKQYLVHEDSRSRAIRLVSEYESNPALRSEEDCAPTPRVRLARCDAMEMTYDETETQTAAELEKLGRAA